MRKRWGYMFTIYKGKYFKLKLLYFKKGKSISLQRHQYRSELWLFLFGKGNFKLPDYEATLKKGGIARVDPNEWHQFTAERSTLVLEIQYGEKCIEDDIERA